MLTPGEVWELSKRWYHNRLSPEYHGRNLAQIEEIFHGLGYTAPFWYMPPGKN